MQAKEIKKKRVTTIWFKPVKGKGEIDHQSNSISFQYIRSNYNLLIMLSGMRIYQFSKL